MEAALPSNDHPLSCKHHVHIEYMDREGFTNYPPTPLDFTQSTSPHPISEGICTTGLLAHPPIHIYTQDYLKCHFKRTDPTAINNSEDPIQEFMYMKYICIIQLYKLDDY